MEAKLELSVILTTFERPGHLARSLASLKFQQGVTGKFEVIVADDGSSDNTHNVVRDFARTVDFPVRLTTHPHCGFRVSLCRNEGVRASSAAYLLFTDGDCIFPPNHLRAHLLARRPNVVRAGSCYRMDEESTEQVDISAIASERYRQLVSHRERRSLRRLRFKDWWYQLMGHRTRPKLTGWNIGIWRCDLEAVNGFDESFVGWGCEDDDLAFRLRRNGVRITSALPYTIAYHMWHPVDSTRPEKWADGHNVERLQRTDRPIRCHRGLVSVLQTRVRKRDGSGDILRHEQSRMPEKVA
jgi:glycosyltransferase involved in cell wall biosynthesis